MFSITGYKVGDKLYEGISSLVYHGTRLEDNKPVVLKLLKGEYPSREDLARFKREYELTNSLHADGAAQVLALEKMGNSYVMVLDDFGGEALSVKMPFAQLDIKTFLHLAIRVAKMLGKIHKHNVIHKDINPSNVIWNSQTDEIRIIDYGISTTLPRENTGIRNPNILDGTLAYISPEQTGRMNRSMDYRTDFYSLGVMFYEMLAGHLPFEFKDPMELVHAHMARMPEPLCKENSDIPKSVSAIVMRLLEKEPERRYQSTYGLIADLEYCLQQLLVSGNMPEFQLGSKDIWDRFSIKEKLYGREQEIDDLMLAFDRCCRGANELMLVIGSPGIGKSSLIQEINKPIVEKKGTYITGKFDQFNKNTPYTAFTQAFRNLMQQILADNDVKVLAWKEKILEALGSNAQVIIDMVPEVEHLIGKQPKVPDLNPTAAQNRFNIVFQNFVAVFVTVDHPLVLALDDLQWADSSSLTLIQMLLANMDLHNLLIVGSYRDNEVDELHPLTYCIEKIKNAGCNVSYIKLGPIDQQSIQQMIVDSFQCSPGDAELLAELCIKKTQGNPFFVRQFLQSLYEEGSIDFSLDTGRWKWDIEEIYQRGVTDNVIELMTKKITRLSSDSQEILQYASCIGSNFDLKTLSMVYGKTIEQTADHMMEALSEGLIMPDDETYKYVSDTTAANIRHHFLHDRVRQAAYEIITEEKKSELHLKIGKLLIEKSNEIEIEEKIFDIAGQFNAAKDLLDTNDLKYQVIALNKQAAVRARIAAAYAAAFEYSQFAIDLMSKNSWNENYQLTLEVYSEGIQAAYFTAQYEKMNEWIDSVAQHAKSNIDKAIAYRIKAASFLSTGQMEKALTFISSALKEYGVNIPKKITLFEIVKRMLKTKGMLAGKKPEDLLNLPRIHDEEKRIAMRLIFSGGPSTLSSMPTMFPILVSTVLQITLKYGLSKWSPMAFIGFASIMAGILNKIDKAYEYASIGIKLQEKIGAAETVPMVCAGYNNFVRHGKEHLRNTLDDLMMGYNAGGQSGDLFFSSMCLLLNAVHHFILGDDLIETEQALKKAYKITKQHSQAVLLFPASYAQVAHNLIEVTDNPECFAGPYVDDNKNDESEVPESARFGRAFFYTAKVVSCSYFNKYEAGREAMKLAFEFFEFGPKSMAVVFNYRFHSVLCCFGDFESQTKKQQRISLKIAKKQIKILKIWAESAPMNYLHKYLLAKAEWYRVNKQIKKAVTYYDQAIDVARENEYLNDEAIACEVTARFYLGLGRERIAKIYLRDAHYVYTQWGAQGKVKQLEMTYPQLISSEGLTQGITGVTTAEGTIATTISSATVSQTLDFATIMKATQAISGEIVLKKLIAKMLHIVIENTGAEIGVLMLERNHKLYIEGECDAEGLHVEIMQSLPVKSSDNLPTSIIQYVQRTHENVVLNEAAREGQFQKDPYIVKNQPKSILCSPIIHHGELIGILYLENNLIPAAFTHDRLEVLSILSSQASISIENARLYQSFERFVPKRFLKLLGKRSVVDVQLGDNTQQVLTVLFCDIRNFTARSEAATPGEVFSYINDYLSYMGSVIIDKHGFIDKYIGDAIMALFPQRAEDAIDAAIGLMSALAKFNETRRQIVEQVTQVGIGINTGLSMLGTVGSEQRMDGSVMGDAVNSAARVEELTKTYGTPILITEQTYNALQDPSRYKLRPIDRVKLRGRTKETQLWEVLDALSQEQQNELLAINEQFTKAYRLFRAGDFAKAKIQFGLCLQIAPEDKTTKYFIGCCEQNMNQSPPAG